jgi:hypothetical protein
MSSTNKTMLTINKQFEEKAAKEVGFIPIRHETLSLLQCMQKHLRQHHVMQSSSHHERNEKKMNPHKI